jgi:hypothetical protein
MLALSGALLRRLPLQRPRGCGVVRAMSRALLAGRWHAASPLEAELRARIADKGKLVAAKDEVIASQKEVYAQACKAHAQEAEMLRHDADLAQGRVSIRAVLEACLEEIARAHSLGSISGLPRSQQLQRLLAKGGCEGLQSYLRVVASDNSIKEDDLLKQAPALYGALSGGLHAQGTGGTTSAPAALFDPHGRTKMVAMAAIARFTGRNLKLYAAPKDPQLPPIKLRVLSPLQRSKCLLTIAEVCAASVVEV